MMCLRNFLVLCCLSSFVVGCPPDGSSDDETDEEGYEAGVPGGCDDGADNDEDGLFDCDDPDCGGAPACDAGASDDDDDDVAAGDDDDVSDEPEAQVYICNALGWSDGSNLEIGMECDDVYWAADTEDCTACQGIEPGTTDCDIYVDGERVASFEPTFDEGETGLLFGSEDGQSISVYELTLGCGTDFDDLT